MKAFLPLCLIVCFARASFAASLGIFPPEIHIGPKTDQQWLPRFQNDMSQVLDHLTLTTLSRLPTAALCRALINSNKFLF